MGFLRRKTDYATTDWLPEDSIEYHALSAIRAQAVGTQYTPTGSGIISGETGGSFQVGTPLWEDVPEQEAGFPDPAGGRVLVIQLGPAATASSETSSEEFLPEVNGTITDVEYVTNPYGAGITGAATNNRVITLNQVTIAGTSSPTRTVTALAAVTFGSGTNAVAQGTAAPGPVPTPLTVSTTSFVQGAPLQVVSSVNGTGLADPGGILYVVYTRA